MRVFRSIVVLLAGCTNMLGSTEDAGHAIPIDAGMDARIAPPERDAGTDAFVIEPDSGAWGDCNVDGVIGDCVPTGECAARGDYRSTAGHCPGPAGIQCCTPMPSLSDNPPIPTGYRLMRQAEVTSEMTAWAIAILRDPITYPMYGTTTMSFGSIEVLARVEWHPPDFNNMAIHRGVTLYVPI